MRIIGGDHKGFRFQPPKNIPARPTTDFAKEGLFNIINNQFYFDEVSFLDLFAGTGSISYEMFSRGCRNITSVELSSKMIKFIKEVSDQLKISDHQILQDDVFNFLKHTSKSYDIIFAGPPYPLENIDDLPDAVMESGVLNKNGWYILETSPRHDYRDHPKLHRLKNYGQTHFWIFSHEANEEQ
ncbi:MAG: RsmD family RNA methyltransferase [Bacteroidetes bacterium]|nr:RsmD family RNA methyltransferase [Bacteroidota bacterium]